MEHPRDSASIVTLAFGMAEAVGRLVERARGFYYAVVLSDHECPKCGNGMEMTREGSCRCATCGNELDPTVAFQRCDACGGEPRLQVRRYRCERCGADVPSRFLFDGLVFDAQYFRQRMAEHRERKAELRERVRQMLAESRSAVIDTPVADLADVPDLVEVLNGLTADLEPSFAWLPSEGFNLQRYQAHVRAHIGPFAVGLEQLPPLSENRRLDRIWRFVAIIFLAHVGLIDVWQEGETIMVMKRETDTEGQGVPEHAAQADGLEGAVG